MNLLKRISTLIACFLFYITSYATINEHIKRVEPPFWWADMHHQELQLLVHGENISLYDAVSNDERFKILRTTKGISPNYLFIDVDISDSTPGSYEIIFSRGLERLVHSYEIRKRDPESAERKGFNTSDVLYLITPDRFANGDTSNDQVDGLKEGHNRDEEYGRHGGDIKGISDHLDYISDLGFTAIWLNPVLENDQAQWSYHGYATTDYYKVDPRFGSNEEYVALSKKAADMGIGLIMDMIENHCGSSHWWMDDLPFSDWLNYQEQPLQFSNHRKSTVHDPYVSKKDRKIMTDGWFVESMPDLNQRNSFMSTYLIQNSIWWIEYAGLTGIRQDTYSYPDPDFMTEWTCRIMNEYPDFNIVAEEWSENPSTIAYWLQGKDNHDGYTSCLKSAMDFPMNAILAEAMSAKEEWGQGFSQLYESLGNDFLYPEPMDLVIFPDNHDMSRIYTRVDEDIHAYKRSLVYILTMRGTPQLYYGTEILMSNKGSESHGVIRSDYPGGWEGDVKNAFTGASLTKDEIDAREFVKTILNWRKNKNVIHQGQLIHFIPEHGVYVYFRYIDSEKVMVVLNKNTDDYLLDLARFNEILKGHTKARDILTQKEFDMTKSITLLPEASLILELE